MRKFAFFLAAAGLLAAGGRPSRAQSAEAIERKALNGPALAADYKIRPGDVLEASVYPQAELSGSLVVFEDGTVQIPTVGRVAVAGLTREECVKTLEERLAKYFVKPKVTLSVVKYSERNIVIGGEVRIPGIVPFVEGMTVSEAVARAGGLTTDSDRKSVRLFRGTEGKRTVKLVDLDAFLNGRAGAVDPKIQMGDMIEVPRLVNAVFIWGEVLVAGRYDYFNDMTIQELIARAHGVTYAAKLNAMRIFHADGSITDVDFAATMRGEPHTNVALRPGDIVVVPNQSFAKFSYWVGQTSPYVVILEFVVSILILSHTGL